MRRRADEIAALANAASTAHHVPVGLLLATGWMESHLGCAAGSGGNWGAPRDIRHRNIAGTPDHAARALARSYVVCGSWSRAVGRFRSGLCAAPHNRDYVATTLSLAVNVYARARVAVPAELLANRPGAR